MPVLRLMEIAAVWIKPNDVDESIHVVVKECVTERKHCVDWVGRGSELTGGKPPVVRKELPEGAIMCDCTSPLVSEQ